MLERFPLYAPRGLCCCKSELVLSQYYFVADSRLAKSLFYGANLNQSIIHMKMGHGKGETSYETF